VNGSRWVRVEVGMDEVKSAFGPGPKLNSGESLGMAVHPTTLVGGALEFMRELHLSGMRIRIPSPLATLVSNKAMSFLLGNRTMVSPNGGDMGLDRRKAADGWTCFAGIVDAKKSPISI
jgi:hypothetical protein